MKFVYWILGILVAAALSLVAAERIASERIEVVELHTLDEAGIEVITRLWVVDDEGFAYLRVGSDGSGWFDRLRENDSFEVTRNDVRETYRAVMRNDKSDHINALMQSKYTWGDSLIGLLVGSREGSIPIELHVIQ